LFYEPIERVSRKQFKKKAKVNVKRKDTLQVIECERNIYISNVASAKTSLLDGSVKVASSCESNHHVTPQSTSEDLIQRLE
jgi:hypothetical protein